jgi:hypothetical protein
MLGYGCITVPDWPERQVDLATWIAFRDSRSQFQSIEEIQCVHPFTKARFTVPASGSARVIHDGEAVGHFFWDAGRIVLDGDPDLLTPLARECAAVLGARLEDEEGLPL